MGSIPKEARRTPHEDHEGWRPPVGDYLLLWAGRKDMKLL